MEQVGSMDSNDSVGSIDSTDPMDPMDSKDSMEFNELHRICVAKVRIVSATLYEKHKEKDMLCMYIDCGIVPVELAGSTL